MKSKKAVTGTAVTQGAIKRLDEIQQNMRTMCDPHYDEFHKLQVGRGFVTITIPKKKK